ncbi:hypothetical protein FB639_005723, partial [Coemansia asiatica]
HQHPSAPTHVAAISRTALSTLTTTVPNASRTVQSVHEDPPYKSHGGSGMSSRAHLSGSQMSIDDIPELLQQLDRSTAAEGEHAPYDNDHNDDDDSNGFGSYDPHKSTALSEEAVVERMRMLAGTSSPTAISNAAQQIMGYVERESRRRQIQSERHHRMVAALADILTQTRASSASRRSSGIAREWSNNGYEDASQQQQQNARMDTDTPSNMDAGSSETTPTMSPAVSSPQPQPQPSLPENTFDIHATTATSTVAMLTISASEPGNEAAPTLDASAYAADQQHSSSAAPDAA